MPITSREFQWFPLYPVFHCAQQLGKQNINIIVFCRAEGALSSSSGHGFQKCHGKETYMSHFSRSFSANWAACFEMKLYRCSRVMWGAQENAWAAFQKNISGLEKVFWKCKKSLFWGVCRKFQAGSLLFGYGANDRTRAATRAFGYLWN